jgi:hypothetical protein
MHPCPAPEPLSPGFDGARLTGGVAHLERPDGRAGCFYLPSGWYYSDAGRQRIVDTVERWQVQLEALQSRVDALVAVRTTSAPPPSLPHLPVFAALVLGLLLGFALGRLTRRKEMP